MQTKTFFCSPSKKICVRLTGLFFIQDNMERYKNVHVYSYVGKSSSVWLSISDVVLVKKFSMSEQTKSKLARSVCFCYNHLDGKEGMLCFLQF